MPDNNKTEEFLQKLAPCIERGELDACVEEAARLAGEMGIGAGELLSLSAAAGMGGRHYFAYVLALAASQGLEGKKKAIAYSNAGAAAHTIGKLKDSEDYYKKAIENDPKNALVYKNYAALLQLLNRKNEAEKYYKKSLELNPNDSLTHSNYALLLSGLNRTNEAESHHKKALELNPNDERIHYNYAVYLKKMNKNDEAEEHYKKAIELNPKNVVSRNNYANILREKSLFYEAEKEVRTALQVEPTNPYVLGTLGDILADDGYFEEAKKEYERALEIVSKNPALMNCPTISEIHNNLGWAYAQLKQYGKAKEEFKMAVNLDPLNVRAIRNLRKLGKIEVIPQISRIQIGLGIVLLLSLIESYHLFWINKLSETMFIAQSTILITLLIFIILYHQLVKVKIGSIEFEMSTEHRFMGAKNQPEFERS